MQEGDFPKDEGAGSELYQGLKVKATLPLTGMRKAIAEHLHRSLLNSAQVTVMGEIDMTDHSACRSAYRSAYRGASTHSADRAQVWRCPENRYW